MDFIKQLFVILSVGLIFTGSLYAQQPIENGTEAVETESETVDEEEYDNESAIIDPETEESQQSVDIINNIIDIVADLEENDSLVLHFAIYNNNNTITEYDEDGQNSMSQKFDVIKAKDDEDYDFTFIRQTIFNANRQAWDFIYERIYNHDGNLIFFVRRYNTYNSGCAEVAFERSEYYYSTYGQLSKKTYDIFDSNNNVLELDNCWMERELYDQIKSYREFISKYPLPL